MRKFRIGGVVTVCSIALVVGGCSDSKPKTIVATSTVTSYVTVQAQPTATTTTEATAVVPTTTTAEAPPPPPPPSSVIYEVDSDSGSADMTYTAEGGATEQEQGASTPWRKEIPGRLSFEYVSAQNTGGGTVSCTLTVDGQVVSEHSSSGEYAIVECSTPG